MKTLARQPASDIASVAFDAGYSEQSHFSRELKLLTGFSPKKFTSLVGSFAEPHLDTWKGMDAEEFRHTLSPKVYQFS